MNPSANLDPVAVAVVIAGLLFGPTLAEVIGPYAIIIISASTGAAWSLGRHPSMTRMQAVVFFLRINFTAMLLSVGVSVILNKWANVDARWLLVPVSVIIGAVGDDWPRVGKWVVGRLGRLIDRKIDNVGPPRGNVDRGEPESQKNKNRDEDSHVDGRN